MFELIVSEQDANFVPYTALMKRDAVSDAYYSHECWYTKPVTLTPYDIHITDLHYRNFFVLRNHQKEKILREFMAMPQSDFVEDKGAFMEAFEKEDINYFFDVGIYDLLDRKTAEKLDLKKWLVNCTYKARAYTDVQYRIMAKCAA